LAITSTGKGHLFIIAKKYFATYIITHRINQAVIYMNKIKTIAIFILFYMAFTSALGGQAAKSNHAILRIDQRYPTLYDRYPWSMMLYYGRTVHASISGIVLGDHPVMPEYIHSIELAYTLQENNLLRHFLRSLVSVIQVAGNVTIRYNRHQTQIY
jgi:phosphatidylglycerophosphate synthase